MTYTAKYAIGDTVWFMHGNKPTEAKVSTVFIRQGGKTAGPVLIVPDKIDVAYTVFNSMQHERIEEAELFTTKEDLIKSL